MSRTIRIAVAQLLLILILLPVACAQTITGSSVPFRSSGSGSGNWTLSENGYVGTYFTLDAPGSVTLTANALGATNDAVAPRMNIVVADTKAGFDVASGFNNYQHTYDLPAGTYFVRTEFANDVPTANRQLTVGSLSVAGATTVSTLADNVANRPTNNNYALAAADTYIEHFRQGPANVALSGLAPGAIVDVKMVRRDFSIGTMVQGFDANVFLAPVSPGDTTSTAARYQNFVKQYFDILVPSNMGKWAHTEPTPDNLTMGNVDTILNYSQNNNLRTRMHHLIWGTQQPNFVNDLIDDTDDPNPAIAAAAKADLMDAIVDRIAYYVGDGDANMNDGDRARKYVELDVLNEALRDNDISNPMDPPTYWEIFGAQGVAEIYKRVKDAVEAAGADTRLYTNEYNIFQFSNPNGGGSDPYANWYRRNVEDINNAGYGEVVTGIGIQGITPASEHNPEKIYKVMHNMAVTGLPITLTEFSVNSATAEQSAQLYDEVLRLMFGHPNATSFLIWEAWPSPSATPDGVTTIVDQNWNLTPSGQALVDLIEAWTTEIDDLVVGPDGTIDFSGFYGEYEITIGGQTFTLDLTKGETLYSIVAAPGDYNGDGTVDAVDYTVWRNTLGSTDDFRADGNGDRTIDENDYNVWKSAYGTTYAFGGGGLASGVVPEPSTIFWLASTAACLLLRRNNREGGWMNRSNGVLARMGVAVLLIAGMAAGAAAETYSGSSLSHRSSGSGSGNWTLSENGYVGTYFTLDAPGSVTLTVNASGATNDAVLPRMNVVVADTKAGFDVAAGFSNYQQSLDLPAGTYFVRTEFANDAATANRQLTVGNLSISGASSVSNVSSTATNNASALATADTYIENYRKGPANLTLVGAAPGTEVRAKLKRHDFRFGTAVGGTFVGGGGNQYDVNTYLNNPNYSNYLRDHFNTVTQGNAGKWASNESTRDVLTMQAVDRIIQYAEDNNLDVRLHNMLWGDSQQPTWAVNMANNPTAIDPVSGLPNSEALRQEISERIDYYVGNGDSNPLNDRARRYQEMDLLNEHSHQAKYWNLYGASGIADIFNESAAAVAAAGSNAKLYLNEYNVFAWGDSYANWYRQDVDEIRDLGGAIGGIGIQYYPSATTNPQAVHSPARMNQILQNLSVTGLDISLTEFGVMTSSDTTVENAATYLEDTMRLVFGTANATTFMMWGFWANDVWDQAPLAAHMDANWNITLPGLTYEALMDEWNTDVTLPVGEDGTIDFKGFYGTYEISIGGQTFELDLLKGEASQFSIVVAPGDYNGDGTVDAVDYIVWRNTLGSSDDLRADGNGDLTIDELDYAVWKSAFGNTYSLGGGQLAHPVPEPAASAILAILTAICAFAPRFGRIRR